MIDAKEKKDPKVAMLSQNVKRKNKHKKMMTVQVINTAKNGGAQNLTESMIKNTIEELFLS